MDKIQKFNSDIQRIKKRTRAEGRNAAKIGEEIARLFENSNPFIRDLCRSLAGFWKEKYVDGTAELTQEAEEKIAALMAFVNNDEGTEVLDSDDWTHIKDEVGFAAEDLPMETLSAMMSVIVENGGI